MIPDDIEMIIMTKEDYDRNVEQLLVDKLKLQDRIDKTIEYTKRFVNGKYSRIDTFENVEVVLQTILQLLKGEDK